MTTLVKTRALLSHFLALALTFLVVVRSHAIEPIFLVASRLQPEVKQTPDVEAGPPRQDIDLVFDADENNGDWSSEDLEISEVDESTEEDFDSISLPCKNEDDAPRSPPGSKSYGNDR